MDSQFQLILDHTLSRILQPRACDQCYERKVRCERTAPCKTCSVTGLTCTYRQRAPKKAGTRLTARAANISSPSRSSHPAPRPSTRRGRTNDKIAVPAAYSWHCESSDTSPDMSTAVASLGNCHDAVIGNFGPLRGFQTTVEEAVTLETSSDHQFDQSFRFAEQWTDIAALNSPAESWTDSPAVFWADVPPCATWTGTARSTMPLPRLVSPRPPTSLASCIPLWPPTGRQSLGAIAGYDFTSPLDAAQISQLVDIFLSRLHLSMPFFKRSYLLDNVRHRRHEHDRQFNALLHSICAYTLFQPIVSEDRHLFSDRLKLAESVLSCAIVLHGCRDFGQEPNLDAVITSFFLFGCQFCRGNHNAALVRLREAQVLAELLRLNDPSGYGNIKRGEFDRRVRTVTALIVIDRIYALQRGTKLQMPGLMPSEVMNLHSLINDASSPEEAPEALAIEGMRRMVDSTDFVDDTVVRCWKNSCQRNPEGRHVTPEKVTSLLARYMRPLRPTSATGTEAQHADILITRHWICSMLWTLAFHHGYTFSSSSKELQPSYAVHIAAETIEACSKFTLSALETHGVGLAEKLFEIAVNLAQVARTFKLNEGETDAACNDCGNAASDSSRSAVLETESLDPTYGAPPFEESDWTAQLPNNSMDLRGTQTILNRFLALLALFRGGNHPFLKPLVDIMSTMNRPGRPGSLATL